MLLTSLVIKKLLLVVLAHDGLGGSPFQAASPGPPPTPGIGSWYGEADYGNAMYGHSMYG